MGYRPREDEPSLVAVAAVVVSGTVSQWFSTQLNQMTSEMVCWSLLPFLFAISSARSSSSSLPGRGGPKKLPNPTGFAPRTPSTASSPALWIVACCLVLNCLYQAEMGRVDLLPFLTPLILMIEQTRDNKAASIFSVKSISAFFASTTWGTCLVAFLAVASWTRWGPLRYTLSLIPMASLMVLFITLRSSSRRDSQFIKPFDFRDAVVPLAGRTLGLLLPVMLAEFFIFDYPLGGGGLWGTLTCGVSKAFWWYSMAQASDTSSWRVATVSTTFSIMSTISPFTQSSSLRSFSHVLVSLLSLSQIIEIALPPRDKPKLVLWVFCLIPIVPYLSNIITIHYLRPSPLVTANHPVLELVRVAQANFDAMLQRQSTTLSEATENYRRRYGGVDPPPGFDAWFEYARSVNSPIIDDYDTIYESVSPFWSLSGAQVHDAMRRVAAQPGADVWSCTLSSSGKLRTRCTHPYRSFDRHNSDMFNSLLGSISLPSNLHLPDVKFLINHLDEPRVLFPPEHGGSSPRIDPTSSKVIINPITQVQDGIFPLLTQSHLCPLAEPPDPSSTSPTSLFHQNSTLYTSLCHSPPPPNSLANQHGLFLSPTNFPLINSFVPILSTGSPSTMSDILYPSPAYSEERFLYDADEDLLPWEKKQDKLYWVGEATGGVARSATADDWKNFHRQRFVSLANGLGLPPGGQQGQGQGQEEEEGSTAKIKYLSESSLSAFSPSSNLFPQSIISLTSTLHPSTYINPTNYDVSFSALPSISSLFSSSRSSHLSQKSFFSQPFTSSDPLRPRSAKPGEAFSSKLAFDLDGNGISGRFYRLLSSSSAVLKQTVFKEWHDDRLWPWVHFFPVSLGMGELGELVRFLLESEEGKEIGKIVGERGREWMGMQGRGGGMREVDRGVYLFRLVLEMGRLGDVGRKGFMRWEGEEGGVRWEEMTT